MPRRYSRIDAEPWLGSICCCHNVFVGPACMRQSMLSLLVQHATKRVVVDGYVVTLAGNERETSMEECLEFISTDEDNAEKKSRRRRWASLPRMSRNDVNCHALPSWTEWSLLLYFSWICYLECSTVRKKFIEAFRGGSHINDACNSPLI
jgi:hypothetical protein